MTLKNHSSKSQYVDWYPVWKTTWDIGQGGDWMKKHGADVFPLEEKYHVDQFVGDVGAAGQQFAESLAGDLGGDRLKLSAVFDRGLGLRIPGFVLAGAALTLLTRCQVSCWRGRF